MDNIIKIASLFKERGMGFYSTTLVVLRMIEDNISEQEKLIDLLEDKNFNKDKLNQWLTDFLKRENKNVKPKENESESKLKEENKNIIFEKLINKGIYTKERLWQLNDIVEKDSKVIDAIRLLLDKTECDGKIIDKWISSYLSKKEMENPVFGKKDKNILWITYDESVTGMLKWRMSGSDRAKSIDYMTIHADFCTSRLPNNLTEEEINKSLDSILWFRRNGFKSALDYISKSDMTNYDEIMVWIDMTASTLLILYMISTYVKKDIYVSIINDTGKFTFLDLGGPDPNYSELLGPAYKITEEMRERFSNIWKEALNHPNEYKITDGGWGIKYVPHTYIDNRLMRHANKRYKIFYDIVFAAQRENLHESFFPYEVYEEALCQNILDGKILVKTKHMKRYMEYNVEKLKNLLDNTNGWNLQVRLP